MSTNEQYGTVCHDIFIKRPAVQFPDDVSVKKVTLKRDDVSVWLHQIVKSQKRSQKCTCKLKHAKNILVMLQQRSIKSSSSYQACKYLTIVY